MKLIGLVQAAQRAGVSRYRMLTLLRAWEQSNPRVRGQLIVHVGKRKRVYVNLALLEWLDGKAKRTLERRVARLEAWAKGVDVWRDEVDADRAG